MKEQVKKEQVKKASAKKEQVKKQVEKAVEEKKVEQKKITLAERAQSIREQIKLKENICFEDEQTAVNKENSAMFLYDNALMLTQTSADKKSAKRILEIWIHAKENDICISKRLFELLEAIEELANECAKINAKKSKSKIVLSLNDDETLKLANALISTL